MKDMRLHGIVTRGARYEPGASLSNPLSLKKRFLDVKLTVELKEYRIVNDCLPPQAFKFVTFSFQHFSRQLPCVVLFIRSG